MAKKVLAIVLSLVMCFSMLANSITAQAAAGTPAMVENFPSTYYKQDGTTGSASDWQVRLTKTAAATATDNVFNITMTIETKDVSIPTAGAAHGAATLVLDVSNSMQNQMGTLHTAVGAFLDSFASTSGDKRLVSVVVFGTNAKTIQGWVDISNATARANLKALVNSLSIKTIGSGRNEYHAPYLGNTELFPGGTNMEAGLVLGRNLLNQSNILADIPASNRSLILFSDGRPTAAVGNVNDTSTTEVSYDGDDEGYYANKKDRNDIPTILSRVSATKIAVKYNYNDEDKILSIPPFTRVVDSDPNSLVLDLIAEAGKIVTTETNASTVTDPMGTGVTMTTVTDAYSENTWDLSDFTPTVSDGITTYTINYTVELDPYAVALDSRYPGYTILTPANGATVLNYTYGESNTPVAAGFNEPNIRGVRTFNVSYAYTGTVPEGANALLPAGGSYKAGTPITVAESPSLANYTFSGWDRTDFTMPAEDVVIYGSWTAIPYTVSYAYEGAVIPAGANALLPAGGTYYAGDSVVVAADPSIAHYQFTGWHTASGSPVTVGDDNAAFTMPGANVVLYGSWTEDPKYTYSVTYNGNGGTLAGGQSEYGDDQNVTGTYDTPYDIEVDANKFTRTNYEFVGWTEVKDGEVVYTAGQNIHFTTSGSKTLYAKWKAIDYTVTYVYDGAVPAGAPTVPTGATYNAGNSVSIAADPSLANYTFTGWFTAEGSAVTVGSDDAAFTMPGANVVLHGFWTENSKYTYTVIYDGNGGVLADSSTSYTDSQSQENTYTNPYDIEVDANTFTRANYTFAGWTLVKDGEVTHAAGEKISFTESGSVTLIAKWTPIDYTVSYAYEGSLIPAGANDLLPTDSIYHAGDPVTVAADVSLPTYIFTGWHTAEGSPVDVSDTSTNFTMPGANVVLYGSWEKVDYTVTYAYEGSLIPAGANDLLPSSHTYNAEDIVTIAADVSLPTYIFTGWHTAEGSAVTVGNADTEFVMPGANVVLYGSWEEVDYTVSYQYEGIVPTGAELLLPTDAIYHAGNEVIVADDVSLPTYIFTGWHTAEGSAVAVGNDDTKFIMPGANVVLYGSWEAIDYTVTYAYEGEVPTGAAALLPVDNNTYHAGDEVTVAADPSLENWTFTGWHTKNNTLMRADAFTVDDEDSAFTMPGMNVTLYGFWTENDKYTYTVFYDGNGGALADSGTTYGDMENAANTYANPYVIEVDDNTFSRAHYHFLGWTLEKDGAIVYNAGDVIDFTESGSVTLYAKWAINEYDYTVEYMTKVDDGAYAPFSGTLPEGAPKGGSAAYGETIGQTDLTGLPSTLTDSEYTYQFDSLSGVQISEGRNVITVYFSYTSPVIEIPDEEPPLAPPPVVEETEPGLIEIPDEDIPMAEVPKTGDLSLVYYGLTALSGAGLLALGLTKKKENDEA